MTDDQYRALLEEGRRKLDAAFDAARERNVLTRNCNGRKDCPSRHHLSVCLSRERARA